MRLLPDAAAVSAGLSQLHSGSCRSLQHSAGQVCFITAGPITKLFAWGGRRVEDMCYERRRAEACVDESAQTGGGGKAMSYEDT